MIDYHSLSAKEKADLMRQIEQDKKIEADRQKSLLKEYNELKDEEVDNAFKTLSKVSADLEQIKVDLFNSFGTLISMKKEVFNLTDSELQMQQTHSFSDSSGNRTIVIGSNVRDGWTDDLGIGIARVENWLNRNIASKEAREIISALLKKDKNGILKAARILDLSKKAIEIGDSELIDAVNFIQKQYKPAKSSTFVKAKVKDENGIWRWIPLSMAAF